MILERSNMFNNEGINKELTRVIGSEHVQEFSNLVRYYRLCQSAVNEIGTKLENLDGEYRGEYDHNPIHHMEQRMKTITSLFNKAEKKHLDRDIESIKQNIFDIGGFALLLTILAMFTLSKKICFLKAILHSLKLKITSKILNLVVIAVFI